MEIMEIREREAISNVPSKYIAAFDYFDKALIVLECLLLLLLVLLVRW